MTVPVEWVEALRDWWAASDRSEPNVFTATRLDALCGAIPKPPWEPTEAQITAACLCTARQPNRSSDRNSARAGLIAFHDAGFDLTLRETT